jgi:hypothetical protein
MKCSGLWGKANEPVAMPRTTQSGLGLAVYPYEGGVSIVVRLGDGSNLPIDLTLREGRALVEGLETQIERVGGGNSWPIG